jgi:hypothetical protein
MRMRTPVHPAARAILVVDGLVALIAGLGLYALAQNADTSFAWTIKAPITAAFLGAGYWGSLVGIAIAATMREWQRVRIVFVTAIVVTTLMLVPTFVYLDQFHLDEGSGTAKVFAWSWLVLYLVQPVALLAVFVMQERAGGRLEREIEEPLLPWLRLTLAAHALGLAAVGVALWPLRADGFWPWAIPDLGAAALAVWLVTFAAGSAWALREGDWLRARVVFPAYLAFLVLILLAALRFSESFDGGAWQTWTWVAAIAVSFVSLCAGAVQQERILRRRMPEARVEPQAI